MLSQELLKLVAWFTPNETEAAFYLCIETAQVEANDPAAVAAELVGLGVNQVVLKRGSRGAWLHAGEISAGVQPFEIEAVDTTAAGDAFNGAFATALMLGMEPIEGARFAEGAAAVAVTSAGAQASMATMEEVKAMLAERNTESNA